MRIMAVGTAENIVTVNPLVQFILIIMLKYVAGLIIKFHTVKCTPLSQCRVGVIRSNLLDARSISERTVLANSSFISTPRPISYLRSDF